MNEANLSNLRVCAGGGFLIVCPSFFSFGVPAVRLFSSPHRGVCARRVPSLACSHHYYLLQ
jgi:hypothetical protein